MERQLGKDELSSALVSDSEKKTKNVERKVSHNDLVEKSLLPRLSTSSIRGRTLAGLSLVNFTMCMRDECNNVIQFKLANYTIFPSQKKQRKTLKMILNGMKVYFPVPYKIQKKNQNKIHKYNLALNQTGSDCPAWGALVRPDPRSDRSRTRSRPSFIFFSF